MRGLVLRLSSLDSDAAAALRIIDFFDTLIERGATPRALVRATAGLAECTAGWRQAEGGVLRADPRSDRRDVPAVAPSTRVQVVDGGTVWLERPGGGAPHDLLVLERMALAASVLGSRVVAPAAGETRHELLARIVSAHASPEARERAIRALGLRASEDVIVLAVEAGRGGDVATVATDLVAGLHDSFITPVAALDGLGAVVFQSPRGQALDPAGLYRGLNELIDGQTRFRGVRVGIGRPSATTDAPGSWKDARTALRFAIDLRVVDYAALGVTRLLAEVPVAALADDPEVARLVVHAESAAGAQDLAVLDAFCRGGSLRAAAQRLHFHHSTVASHLQRVEAVTGWDLTDPDDRFRARMTLLARDLSRGPTTAERQ